MGAGVVFGFLLTLAIVPFTEATARTFTAESSVEYDSPNGDVSDVSFRFKNGLYGVMEHRQESILREIFFQTDATEKLTIYHDSKIVYVNVTGARPNSDTIGYVAMDSSREWHTVTLTFQGTEARLEVDGVSYYSYLSKVPQLNKKITVGKNFAGCLDDLTLNGENIQDSGKFDDLQGCSLPPYLASFTGAGSYINMSLPTEKQYNFLRLIFGFRTFAAPTDLAEIELGSGATIQVRLKDGRTIEVIGGTQRAELGSTVPQLTDGNYHSVLLEVTLGGRFDIWIDTKYIYNFTESDLVSPDANGIVGIDFGSKDQNAEGFEGCMRNFLLRLGPSSNDTENFDLSDFSKNTAVIGKCSFQDFCRHEPCAHDTPCIQTKTGLTYSCDCGDSGYEGSDCLKPRIFTETCTQEGSTEIDPDGTGPVRSFQVMCSKDGDTLLTEIPTVPQGPVNITENEYPYRKTINYRNGVTYEQLESLISRSQECKQMISFTCKDSRLMTKMDGSEDPFGYWEGGSLFEPRYYWGGSNSSFLYQCADGNPCQCDDNDTATTTDEGYLTTEMDLPVSAVVFNESVDDATDTSATYMVGPLMCSHDRYLDDSSAVTFNGTASLGIESVIGDIPFDISFMFKTTVAQGYLIHSEVIKREGSFDLYFSVEISGKRQLLVNIQSREVYLRSFPVPVTSDLDDGVWKSFYFEMNHNQALVEISRVEVFLWRTEEFIPNPKLYPTDKIYVGGSPNGTMGFIGCIKNLRILGEYFELTKHVTDGIHGGCTGPCDSSPCLNGGSCREIGTTFVCDCTQTGYTGCYCGKDSSVDINESEEKTYESRNFTPRPEKIFQVGFITQTNNTKFLAVSEANSNIKLEISVSNEGSLSVKVVKSDSDKEQTFADRVDDNMPHYISLHQADSRSIIQLDNANLTFPEELFPLLDTHTIRVGTIDENLQPNQTYTGCIFSVLSGNQKILLDQGNAVSSSCAPSHVPMGLRAHKESILKHINASKQKSNEGSAPPSVESFSAYSLNNALMEMGRGSVALSGPIRLVCNASGSPKPRIIWKRNNVVRESDCYHLMTHDSLILHPENDPETGIYTCEAVNLHGVSRSLNSIEIVTPVPDNTLSTLEQKTVASGNTVSFPCDLGDYSVPRAVAVWERQISQGGLDSTQILWPGSHDTDRRIRVTNGDGTLVFSYVLTEDNYNQQSSTTFVCFRVNPSTGERNKATSVQLTVTGTNPPTISPEIIFSTESPVNAMEGDDITLECIGRDNNSSSSASIEWYHDGKKMETNDIYGQSLQILSITEEQAGIYTCRLDDSDERNISVNVNRILKLTKSPERLIRNIDEDAVFKCLLNTENYTVQWLSNYGPLPASERYILDNSNTTLTIRNVSKESDLQTIACIATAGDVKIIAEGSLTVVDPLRITSYPKDKVLGDGGVEFCVVVETDPLLEATFTWKKDNATLTNMKLIMTTVVSLTEAKNCLKLTGSDASRGKYTCLVYDGISMKSASANLFAAHKENGLPPGAIIGIVVGSIFAITLVAAIIGYFFYKQNRTNRKYGIEGTAGAYKNPAYAN